MLSKVPETSSWYKILFSKFQNWMESEKNDMVSVEQKTYERTSFSAKKNGEKHNSEKTFQRRCMTAEKNHSYSHPHHHIHILTLFRWFRFRSNAFRLILSSLLLLRWKSSLFHLSLNGHDTKKISSKRALVKYVNTHEHLATLQSISLILRIEFYHFLFQLVRDYFTPIKDKGWSISLGPSQENCSFSRITNLKTSNFGI